MGKFTSCCAAFSGLFGKKTKQSSTPHYALAEAFIHFNQNGTGIRPRSALSDFNQSIVIRNTRVVHNWDARYHYTLDRGQQDILHQHMDYLTSLSSRDDFAWPTDYHMVTVDDFAQITHAQAQQLLDQLTTITRLLGSTANDDDGLHRDTVCNLAHQIRRSMYHEMAINDPVYFTAVVDISNLEHGASSKPFTDEVTELSLAKAGHSITPDQERYQIRIQPLIHDQVKYDVMATILQGTPAAPEPVPTHLINVHGTLHKHGTLTHSDSSRSMYEEDTWTAFNQASKDNITRYQSEEPIAYTLSDEDRQAILQRCHATHSGADLVIPTNSGADDEEMLKISDARLWVNPIAAPSGGSALPLRPTPPTCPPPADAKRAVDERRPAMI
ncbi:MAG: hypothetical protein P1U40_01795 [Coxiellaceae bacterium]|nr:hypothetical protein [Coxiellaceae bacterium]